MSMHLRLEKITIENFRGIGRAEAKFSESNFLVGDNGTGKTTVLAAIARLVPALRREDRIFLDADFSFNSPDNVTKIKILYDVKLVLDNDSTNEVTIELVGERQNTGISRSYLNDQEVAKIETNFTGSESSEELLEALTENGVLKQRIIRNGWGGGRIAPISLDNTGRQRHAATNEKEESGNFDGLRARLIELLKESDIGKIVKGDHPDLRNNTLGFANRFLGENRFIDFRLGYSDQLVIERNEGLMQPWEGLSGGEQSAFNLAMAIQFEKMNNSQILIIEEPENNLHPVVQKEFINIIRSHLPGRQIFIATHSPYLFESHLHDSSLVITKKNGTSISIDNATNNPSLFSQFSWGEISYYAYDLSTFEFHNELYGWIQDRTNNMTERNMENYIKTQHGVTADKAWTRSDRNNQPQAPYDVTVMTYIRNYTHHPENTFNLAYTEAELSRSIRAMLGIVNAIR